jgi:thiazole synthase ThiGH ThiG subunit
MQPLPATEPLVIAGRTFQSRLFVGTGKFSSNELMRDALRACGTELVTVALKRADLTGQSDPFADILDYLESDRYLVLPNTAGAMNAEEAVRIARLAAAAGVIMPVGLHHRSHRRTGVSLSGSSYRFAGVHGKSIPFTG